MDKEAPEKDNDSGGNYLPDALAVANIFAKLA